VNFLGVPSSKSGLSTG